MCDLEEYLEQVLSQDLSKEKFDLLVTKITKLEWYAVCNGDIAYLNSNDITIFDEFMLLAIQRVYMNLIGDYLYDDTCIESESVNSSKAGSNTPYDLTLGKTGRILNIIRRYHLTS